MSFSFDHLRLSKAEPPYKLSSVTSLWDNYLEYFNSKPRSEADTEDFMSLKPILDIYPTLKFDQGFPVEVWGEQKLYQPETAGELIACLIETGRITPKQIVDCIRFSVLVSEYSNYPLSHIKRSFTNTKVHLTVINSLIEHGHEKTARNTANKFLTDMGLSYFRKLDQDKWETRVNEIIEIINHAETAFWMYGQSYFHALSGTNIFIPDKALKEKLLLAIIAVTKKDKDFKPRLYKHFDTDSCTDREFIKFLFQEGILMDENRYNALKALKTQIMLFNPHELNYCGITIAPRNITYESI